MKIFENDTQTRMAFTPTAPVISDDGSISAFKSGDTSALRALETIVEPGTLINGFEVGRMLGRGGIAAVYEGVQLETGRGVALKILDARFTASPEIVSKFLAEGETLATFDHPNIVKHIAHGSDETFVYIAMGIVSGITLDQLIHAIELRPHHYLHLASEISKGLTRVHAEGVVHGDIKPSNILVTRPGEVKITDFGVAARVASLGQDRAGNKVYGTAAYMAPELFNKRATVDYRADIYSLGVTFTKVFTGKLPAHPWVPVHRLNPSLPLELDGVLLRALQENPDDRYVTVKEFCDAMAAVFDKDALKTPVPITPDREAIEAAEVSAENQAKLKHEEEARKKNVVDWKLIVLCCLAAIGFASVLLGVAIFYGKW